MSCCPERPAPLASGLLALALLAGSSTAAGLSGRPTALEELGSRWGTAKEERRYYPIVTVPTPEGEVIEAGVCGSTS